MPLRNSRRPFRSSARLVVEDVAPPVPHHELREEHGDDVVLPAGVELVDVAQDRAGQLPVGGVDDLERDLDAVLLPQLLDASPAPPRRRPPTPRPGGWATATARRPAPRARRGARRRRARRRCGSCGAACSRAATRSPSATGRVVPVDRLEQQHDHRDHHERHPGAARELRGGDDEQHDARSRPSRPR